MPSIFLQWFSSNNLSKQNTKNPLKTTLYSCSKSQIKGVMYIFCWEGKVWRTNIWKWLNLFDLMKLNEHELTSTPYTLGLLIGSLYFRNAKVQGGEDEFSKKNTRKRDIIAYSKQRWYVAISTYGFTFEEDKEREEKFYVEWGSELIKKLHKFTWDSSKILQGYDMCIAALLFFLMQWISFF